MAGNAVVALSGGQDSATCLHWALREYDRVEAVSFNYGQRHSVELECAATVARKAGVARTVLDVPALAQLEAASLTNPAIASQDDAAGTANTYAAQRGLPSSFVPGRNIVLLGLAAAYGAPRDLNTVVTGVCARDRAGYPDCRAEFVDLLAKTVRVAIDLLDFEIAAPLLERTKAQTWALADKLGVLPVVRYDTHTCYEGDHEHLHDWGYGCGECPACEVRAEGWREYQRQRRRRPRQAAR